MEGEHLGIELEKIAKHQGIDLFGMADLTSVQDFICRQGGEYIKKFPRAISLGIHLLDGVINELNRHNDPAVIYTYKGLYNSVNSSLDHIALLLAKKIQQKGYRAYPIPASQTIDSKKLIGVISHKLVANLAGLGWIGKSCLLISPKYGPRVRFSTILTDVKLATGSPSDQHCDTCEACVNICPVKAFTGVPFNPIEKRDKRFKAHLCYDYMNKRERDLGEDLCGLCVYICPFGRS